MFDFETLVDRNGIGNMKGSLTAGRKDKVLLFGAEMDFATAPVIRKKVAEFASRGLYAYTLPDEYYRNAICIWFASRRGFEICAEWIVPTMGTILGIGTAVRAFTQPGDGVIIQHPAYERFERPVETHNRRVVSNPMKEENAVYTLDLENLESLMAESKNKLMILCNPHNPTGKVFNESDLKRIAELAKKYCVIVLSDEIFAETAQPGHEVAPFAKLCPEWGITSSSLGKTFNFTGVNQANLIIPNRELREKYLAQRYIDHFGSIDPFFYNALIAAYTNEGWQWVQEMNAHVLKIYRHLESRLSAELPMLRLAPLEGSFVGWIDFRALGLNGENLKRFWEDADIILDPGTEYGPGGEGFARINLATTTSVMDAFVDHLKKKIYEKNSQVEASLRK